MSPNTTPVAPRVSATTPLLLDEWATAGRVPVRSAAENRGSAVSAVPSGYTRGPCPTTEEDLMCASCGCDTPNDDHGDTANITTSDIERAASAAGVTPAEVVENLRAAVSA